MGMGGGPGVCIDVSASKIFQIWSEALANPNLGDGFGNNQIVTEAHHALRTIDGEISLESTDGIVRFVWDAKGFLIEQVGNITALNNAHRDLVREHNLTAQISPA